MRRRDRTSRPRRDGSGGARRRWMRSPRGDWRRPAVDPGSRAATPAARRALTPRPATPARGCRQEPPLRGALLPGPMAVEAPSLAACRRQQGDVNAFRGVLRERAAHPERFVIGMGEYGHQLQVHRAAPGSADYGFQLFRPSSLGCLQTPGPGATRPRPRRRPDARQMVIAVAHRVVLEKELARERCVA